MARTATVPAVPTNGHAPAPAVPEPALLDRVIEATHQSRQFSVAEIEQMAKQVGKSGFGFNEAQAFTLMMLCEADGVHPIHALRRYDINEYGKYTMKYTAMLAEMVRLGWEVKLLTDPNNAEYQEFSFAHPTRPVVVAKMAFGVNEAKAAGLMTKKNYQGYAPDMFRARAISRACRLNEPGIVSGVYTPEEAAEFSDRPAAAAPAPPAPPRPAPTPPPVPRPHPAPPQPEPPDESPPPRSEVRAWIQDRIDEANSNWAMTCGAASKDYVPLCKNVHHLVNGIVSDWLEEGKIHPDVVETFGKRNKVKVGEFVRELWRQDRDGLMEDVIVYLEAKQREAAAAAGINLDSDPDDGVYDDDEPVAAP